MNHNWQTELDSLGFVDKRVCTKCGTNEIRENMPGSQGSWHQRDYKKTPECKTTSLSVPKDISNFFDKLFEEELG